ncbi:MAG: SPASM domain-containing protein [Actinomycetota bacterium]|nr:SPASM domain-containing protein [Actinomycetota bacterium]
MPATSRYTFRLPLADGYALFNTSSGGVMRLDGPDADELSTLLSGPPTAIDPEALGADLTAQLRRGGFLVDPGFDEVGVIRERYWAARGETPISLLVTTTMDCNLGCYYCFETRSSDSLRVGDADDLVAIARERLGRSGKRSLHVDWYGGEPLLNVEFLEAASAALQELCAELGVGYLASIISNGTRWPDDVGAFVARHRLHEVQISFDGMRANHDKRRHYRRAHPAAGERSPFELGAELVGRLLEHTRVDVRYNADPGNAGDLDAFLDFAAARGWFDAPHRCVVSVAKLTAYSGRSEFMRRRELDEDEYDALQELARHKLPLAAQDDQDVVGGFPYPKTSVCGALAPDSAVVGADGLEYRCGLQVGETERAVGRFSGQPAGAESFGDAGWWESWDPTALPTCSRCSFLPVCWGGCPKRHLDGDQANVDLEGRFWRSNLPRMIAAGFGEEPPPGFAYGEADQFRDGPPPLRD